MTSLRPFAILIALALPACADATDIAGTYSGKMTRSQTCGAAASPTSASADVEIVDTTTEHVGHILGAKKCDFVFEVTDYGGVGTVTSVKPGCAFQPEGMELVTGDFSPSGFTFQWKSSDGSSCTITDSWDLEG